MSDYPTFGFVTPDNMALLTDLYELTMADSYLRHGLDDLSTFSLFMRDLPANRAFLLSAGLEQVLHYLEGVRFVEEAIGYLRSLGRFSDAFLDYLRDFRFTGSVRAIPEGEVFFPQEPLLEITAPRIEAQVVETFILNTLNFQVTIASKAARIVVAAQGRPVVDFSPRQDHGTDAALKVARASYIAGCAGTSCVLAGALYGIPVYGTMAHSYVMSFEDELEAFRAFAEDFPDNCLLLIDTYDTVKGAERAIRVARELAARGGRLAGVRIDSGDLGGLSRKVRTMLDDAGLRDVQIFLTHELNEFKIADLIREGAAVDAFGVGTELGTSADAPFVGGTYKLVEDTQGYRMKLSAGKATIPGKKQVWRNAGADGLLERDTVTLDEETGPDGSVPLMIDVMRDGRVAARESLPKMRARAQDRIAHLPPALRALQPPAAYRVGLSSKLRDLHERMVREGTGLEELS